MQEVIVEESVRQFIREYCDGRSSLELLLFLGRHPYARFSELAIVHALDTPRADVEKALRQLTVNRLVVTWNAENGLPFYSLTDDETLCGLVSELVALDWWQYQLMLGQTED